MVAISLTTAGLTGAVLSALTIAAENKEILRPQADAWTYRYHGCFASMMNPEEPVVVGSKEIQWQGYPTKCAWECLDWNYFAMRNGSECYCGSQMAPESFETDPQLCNTPCKCTCAKDDYCGGSEAWSVYRNDTGYGNMGYMRPIAPPVKKWSYLGCYSEVDPNPPPVVNYKLPTPNPGHVGFLDGGKALPVEILRSQHGMNADVCTNLCKAEGYVFAGVKHGDSCHCGNNINPITWVDGEEGCSTRCTNGSEFACGNTRALNMYAMENPPLATVKALDDWLYVGCGDNKNGTILTALETQADLMTPEKCAAICDSYPYMGLEGGNMCRCGGLYDGGLPWKGEGECFQRCAGDAKSICGAGERVGVYAKRKVPQNKELINGKYKYMHCGMEDPETTTDRLLTENYKDSSEMSLGSCGHFCDGFAYFGVEYGRECFCGNEYRGVAALEGDCHVACTGDESEICGGRGRVSIYAGPDAIPKNGRIKDENTKEVVSVDPARQMLCRAFGRCRHGATHGISMGRFHKLSECVAASLAFSERNKLKVDEEIKAIQWSQDGLCVGLSLALTSDECGFLAQPQKVPHTMSFDLTCFTHSGVDSEQPYWYWKEDEGGVWDNVDDKSSRNKHVGGGGGA